MKKIQTYKTVQSSPLGDLDEKVCEALAAGWELYGNPYVVEAYGSHKPQVCQAMVWWAEDINAKA